MTSSREALVEFRCNICGKQTAAPASSLGREDKSCHHCGSSVRMRAIAHHLALALFGQGLAVPDFPLRRDLRGVGLSDWKRLAKELARRLDYTNTFYHRPPRLDVTNVPGSMAGTCDFVLSADVFEHVAPPVSRAFEGARRLLKPGGTLVLTVPFSLDETPTREHFPHLHEFRIEGGWWRPRKLVNKRVDGTVEVFDAPAFHGGPGMTLEMRVFTRRSLQAELEQAGFVDIRFATDPVPASGIQWQGAWSVPVVAQAPASYAR